MPRFIPYIFRTQVVLLSLLSYYYFSVLQIYKIFTITCRNGALDNFGFYNLPSYSVTTSIPKHSTYSLYGSMSNLKLFTDTTSSELFSGGGFSFSNVLYLLFSLIVSKVNLFKKDYE